VVLRGLVRDGDRGSLKHERGLDLRLLIPRKAWV
jgi:hypothetical protein